MTMMLESLLDILNKLLLFLISQDVTLTKLYNEWLYRETELEMTNNREIKPPVGESLEELYKVFEEGGIYNYGPLTLCYDVNTSQYLILLKSETKDAECFSGHNRDISEIYKLFLDLLKGEVEFKDVR